MSASVLPPVDLVYPESDGAPLGENTRQIQAIIALHNGFTAHFLPRPDVFVASDLFWYPVEGEPKVVQAPDLMVAFGRPKGERRSYKQWEEGDTPPQVVMEVLSPSDRPKVRQKKLDFYDCHGVEEYVEYDPDRNVMRVWTRTADGLIPTPQGGVFDSPRLGVRLTCGPFEPLRVFRPDGSLFLTYAELVSQNELLRRHLTELAAKLRALGHDPDA